MLSSAVTIPAPDTRSIPDTQTTEEVEESSMSLKRKFSGSHNQNHNNKRPCAQPTDDSLNYDDAPRAPAVKSTAHSPVNRTTSPDLRRAKTNLAEEKKRNQRLFGGILGVVSQKPASINSAHRKRDEIEARARERQRKEHEEEEAERARRREVARQRRIDQHKIWIRDSQTRKHENMRHMSGFLLTKTEPRLYYKPWELLREDEEVIQHQRNEVEEQICRELGIAHNDLHNDLHTELEPVPMDIEEQVRATTNPKAEADLIKPHQNNDSESYDTAESGPPPQKESEGKANTDAQGSHGEDGQPVPLVGVSANESGQHQALDLQEMQDDDHHDGELVEGQEDDVIY